MDTETVKKAIKEIVLRHQPDAEVILYGSRARGDAEPDSDWDILILLPESISFEEERKIQREVYEWEWNNDEVITVMFNERSAWDSALMRATAFRQNVAREGIAL